MKILAVDTTAVAASCAVVEDSKLICESFVNVKLKHSQTLMPMVRDMLKCSDLDISDIDAFAVNVGPGSFTGVRIGVSAVKGMAFFGDRPCIPVSSLHSLSLNLTSAEGAIICPVMDARCSQVYNAIFEIKNGESVRLCDDRAVSIDFLLSDLEKIKKKRMFLVGDGAQMCYNIMKSKLQTVHMAPFTLLYQRASSVASAAEGLYADGKAVKNGQLVPFYLRPSQAERNLKLKNKE